jgi:hypothetical protein
MNTDLQCNVVGVFVQTCPWQGVPMMDIHFLITLFMEWFRICDMPIMNSGEIGDGTVEKMGKT